MKKRLFTIQEASEYLGFRRQRLYDWVCRGKIPYVRFGKVGSRIRFDRADLDALIEELKVTNRRNPLTR